MQQNTLKLILGIGLVIFLSILAMQFNEMTFKVRNIKNSVERITKNMTIAQDSIKTLNALTDSLKHNIIAYSDSLDSLSKVKSKVIIKYRDQKNFVSDASIIQLDSIIRANTSIGK